MILETDTLLIGSENPMMNQAALDFLLNRNIRFDYFINKMGGGNKGERITLAQVPPINHPEPVCIKNYVEISWKKYKQVFQVHYNYSGVEKIAIDLKLALLPGSVKKYYLYHSTSLRSAIDPLLQRMNYSEKHEKNLIDLAVMKWHPLIAMKVKFYTLSAMILKSARPLAGFVLIIIYYGFILLLYIRHFFRKGIKPTGTHSEMFKKFLWTRYVTAPQNAASKTIEAGLFRKMEYRSPSLELGCGDGIFSSIMLDGKIIDIGSDYLPEVAERARKYPCYKSVQVADATNLPFSDNSFKTVFFVHGIDHIQNKEPVIREAARVLQCGGIFALSDVSEYWEMNYVSDFFETFGLVKPSHRYKKYRMKTSIIESIWTESQYRSAFQGSGFKILDFSYFDSIPFHKVRALMRMFTLELMPVTRMWLLYIEKIIKKISPLKSIYKHVMEKSFLPFIESDEPECLKTKGGNLFIIAQKIA
ncbi:MAG: class I SAM-dependent methyltransferase [Bacteroidetes bacterium]|nr:class I SAM-dependent methyltransferase [Bacteroidota bacterium]